MRHGVPGSSDKDSVWSLGQLEFLREIKENVNVLLPHQLTVLMQSDFHLACAPMVSVHVRCKTFP